MSSGAPRHERALEDARAEARTRLTERRRALAGRRASGIVTASITPELAALAPPELASRLTALEAHCRAPRRAAVPGAKRWPRPGGSGP